MKKVVSIFALLVGAVFCLLGIGKTINVNDFAQSFSQYGLWWGDFLAPPLVWTEVAVGLLLVFRYRLRQVSLAAITLLVAVTAVFLYGYLFREVKNCGCFGALTLFDLPPVATFVRNAVLLALLFYVWKHSSRAPLTALSPKVKIANLIMAVVMFTVFFLSGYTYRQGLHFGRSYAMRTYTGKAVGDTPLRGLITTSKDTSYLVFAFSYGCPHCYNSIANLKEYESSGSVDKVIALSYVTDSTQMQWFHNVFYPQFEIKHYPPQELFALTSSFPVSYYITGDIVRMKIRGELPCSYVFRCSLEKR
jgi:uncharacterized membrane protein YphA (DoxX/SURF4 family)